MEWCSLLKKRTASKKQKVAERQEWLDKKQALLEREEIAIGLLNHEVEELMEDAKKLHALAEAPADANIKAQEDLNKHAISIAYREHTTVEREQELRVKEKDANNRLEREHGELSSCEADLNTREAVLEMDRKSLEDLRTEVLARELAAEFMENNQNFRERELADKEK
jgi:hypothetical protein